MISKKRLLELERAEAKLRALENGGVDNWQFYDDALTEYNNNIEKEIEIENLLEDIESTLLYGAYEPSERGAGFAATEEAREDTLKIINDFMKDYEKINR